MRRVAPPSPTREALPNPAAARSAYCVADYGDILQSVEESSTETRQLKSWLLAFAAVAVCGPWPGWEPAPVALLLVCAGLLALARPSGRARNPWYAVVVALMIAVWPSGGGYDRSRLENQLDRHCQGMLVTGEALATDSTVQRLLGAAGEVVDPASLFAVLDRSAVATPGRTIYLADDRGQIVAWGGAGASFPYDVRPLGQRQWGISWSAGSADLWLRDPLLVDGRLVGAVIIADRTALQVRKIWGMRAGRGRELALGIHRAGFETVTPPVAPGVNVPVISVAVSGQSPHQLRWLGWMLLAVLAVAFQPRVGVIVVAAGATALLLAPGTASDFATGAIVLLAGAALGRMAGVMARRWSRLLVSASLTGASLLAVFANPVDRFSWLPEHLLGPGWGGVWMVALAWLVSGWPGVSRSRFSLGRRLRAAAALALIGLSWHMLRVPVELARSIGERNQVVLPRGDVTLIGNLPASPYGCRLNDLAPVVADRWRLADWQTPSELLLIDEMGTEISRWGDLGPAGADVRVLRTWFLEDPEGYSLELAIANEPWSLLGDWCTGLPIEASRGGSIWSAVLTRTGEVAAGLHPEIEGLDPVSAGELFHAGGGWARIDVGDVRRLARVQREGQWLALAIANHPSASDWVVRAIIALMWALFGTVLALPPIFKRQHLSTFGGRLRLLVTGGVVLPLAILTLFLHQRITGQEQRLEQNRGLDALQAARYTAVHLGGGFAVDDQLARWLAAGWGGEVCLWDGDLPVAASRPDLVVSGVLPQLPLAATYPPFLLGRDDPVILRWRDLMVAAGPVELQGSRLLLHLYRSDPVRSGADLGAVDWLLTGALLSALLALLLTTRIEERLSTSLREIVALARKLLDGEPVGPLRRPRETDLAEVLDAVRSMNEEVQQRELRLRHQEELLRITLKTLEPAVVVLEPDGTERFANPSALQFQEEYGERFLEQLRSVVEDASIGGSVSKTVQPIPGRDVTWKIGVAAVPFPDGDRGLVAVVDDVTDLVRADRLQQLNQMARIVAHEVKNPLTPIRLWVEELEAAIKSDNPELPELLVEACREIADQVKRLQETASSFSNLVALERWEPEPVDLAKLIEELPSGADVLERRGIRIEYEVESTPPPITGDRQWLRRAVANLLQNSLDVLGDAPGTVVLRLEVDRNLVVLEVEDTGGGVPDERLPDLFSPHFSSTTSGSGLGLALVQQVVVRCHGSVSATNAAHGLKVRLEFPTSSSLDVGDGKYRLE
jgi:nitrogen-specific signal transduction histidine kinase